MNTYSTGKKITKEEMNYLSLTGAYLVIPCSVNLNNLVKDILDVILCKTR